MGKIVCGLKNIEIMKYGMYSMYGIRYIRALGRHRSLYNTILDQYCKIVRLYIYTGTVI